MSWFGYTLAIYAYDEHCICFAWTKLRNKYQKKTEVDIQSYFGFYMVKEI